MTKSEMERLPVENGEFIFKVDRPKCYAVYDIQLTHHHYPERQRQFTKNRVIRTNRRAIMTYHDHF